MPAVRRVQNRLLVPTIPDQLAAYRFARPARSPPNRALRPIELDICAQRWSRLWIGEAKISDRLGSAQAEKGKLNGLLRAADVIRPHGILLVTGSDSWSDRTQRAAREILGNGPWRLELASSPRPSASDL